MKLNLKTLIFATTAISYSLIKPSVAVTFTGGTVDGQQIPIDQGVIRIFEVFKDMKAKDKVLNFQKDGNGEKVFEFNLLVRNETGDLFRQKGKTWGQYRFEIIEDQQTPESVRFNDESNPTSKGFKTPKIENMGKSLLWTDGSVLSGNEPGDFQFQDVLFTFSLQIPDQNFTLKIKNIPIAVPEPPTISGTGVVLGVLPVLKKKRNKTNEKKDEDAQKISFLC